MILGRCKERARGRNLALAAKPCSFFLSVLLPFQNLARYHDEATTSDYGSDIGDQFNIVTSANEHGGNA
jgi:hypothetical protein